MAGQYPNGRASRQANHPSARALPDEPHYEHLVVYKGNRVIGYLVQEPNSTVFRYARGEGRLDRHISESPLSRDQLTGKGRKLPPFFANLLPEGQRKKDLCESLGIDPNDEFSLLAAVGTSTIGDIYVHSGPGVGIKPIPTVTAVDGILQDENLEDMLRLASDTSSRSFDPDSVPGVQNKVSRLLESLSGSSSESVNNVRILQHVIIKCEEPHLPQIVENERFFLELAKECGIEIPPHLFLQDKDGHRALVLERFDRVHDGNEIGRRIHVEDGCQLLNLRPEDKYKTSFQKLTRVVMESVDDAPRAAEEMVRLFAFSYAIGNHDLHAKNVSIWKNPTTGERELSPAYDILSAVPYKHKDVTALPFGDKKSKITRNDFCKFGEDFGMLPRDVDAILENVTDVVGRAVESGRIGMIGMPPKEVDRIERFLRARIEQMRPPITKKPLSL